MTVKDDRLVSGRNQAAETAEAEANRQTLVLNIGLESDKYLDSPLIEPL